MSTHRTKHIKCKNYPECLKVISGGWGLRKKNIKTGYCTSCLNKKKEKDENTARKAKQEKKRLEEVNKRLFA